MLGDTEVRPAFVRPWYRTRTFYRLAIALPVASIAFGIIRGHFTTHFVPPAQPRVPPLGSNQVTLSLLAGLAVWGPLGFASWDLGYQRTTARRMGYLWLAGLREVLRQAVGRVRTDAEIAAEQAAASDARDNAWAALAWSAPVAVIIPAFLLVAASWLRTPVLVAWVIGAGVLMGSTVYFRRRAIAYLVDEPSPWAMFGGFRKLDTSRYAERGRVFVRLQILSMILTAVWWLGVGAVVMTRFTPPTPH
ncbi:MAG TPA: hypothetical protein VF118_13150 [Gemmatimonadaceae bacterium]